MQAKVVELVVLTVLTSTKDRDRGGGGGREAAFTKGDTHETGHI